MSSETMLLQTQDRCRVTGCNSRAMLEKQKYTKPYLALDIPCCSFSALLSLFCTTHVGLKIHAKMAP